MKQVRNLSLLRWLSLAVLAGGVLLLIFQLVIFSRLRNSFSFGSTIAGVDVSGLNVNEAADRLTQAYSVPVELRYGESSFQVKPSSLGFSLDLSSMVAAADQARASLPFWSAFWDYLFNRFPESQDIPISANIDVTQMRSFLENEVAARYDQNPEPFLPIPGTAFFSAGKAGLRLDVDRSVELISAALKSPTERVVNLSIEKNTSSRPSLENLKVLLSQIIDSNGFTGVVEVYMHDLQTGQDMQFAYQAGEQLVPDIAFSADSTIKIPVLIEIYRRKKEPLDEATFTLLREMITVSNNDATDAVMKAVIDPNLGPLEVTATVKKLGLENTFLAGMFYPGAPLLRAIKTPSNSRTDISLNPDPYNQTTPTDIGSLMTDVYQCSQNGGGSLVAVFPGEITQNECRAMISLLANNRLGWLIEAGLPDGTQVAHKHGFHNVDYGLGTIGDTALVYSPGGNFILAIYVDDENPIVFDRANSLYADLTRAVYNYFNLTN